MADETLEFDFGFWKKRSANYDSLEWVNRPGYLDAFLSAAQPKETDKLLDIGTGTGVIANRIAPYVSEVTGIDASPEMLEHARLNNQHENLAFEEGDVRKLAFEDGSYHKVTARMVFHHVLESAELGVREIFRVLKPGGIFVLSEGIPPTPELRDWYTEMFAFKEERRTFLEEDLKALAAAAPFAEIKSYAYISRGVSIRNWLDNGAVSDTNRKKIWQMHLELDHTARDIYNMQITDDGDIVLDMTFIIVVAVKPI